MQKKFVPAYLLTLVNVLGFSLLLPVLPFVVARYGGSDAVYGFVVSLYSFCQFLAAPLLGRLSDSQGRKPILLISQGGTLLSWVIFGAAWFLPDVNLLWASLPLAVIALARIMDGLTGGNVSVTQAYVSDVSSHNEKSTIFGTLGGVAGIGMILGPGLGGFLASGSLGFLGLALGGATLSLLTLGSIRWGLTESLPIEARRPPSEPRLSDTFRFLNRIRRLAPSKLIKQLFMMRVFFSAMMSAYVSTIPLFLIDLFDFDAQELGLFMVVVGGFLAFNQAVLSKWFIRRLGERRTMTIGLCLSVLGFFTITLTEHLWMYCLYYYVLNLGFCLIIPALNALLAQRADPQQMGEVMGIGNAIASLSNALIPVFAASMYGILGAEFYHLVATLPAMALLLAMRLQSDRQHLTDHPQPHRAKI